MRTHRGRHLNDWEIASRLSYLLWNTMPDAELFALAEQGQLRDKAVLAQQVARLLADARSQRFTDSFATQWLRLKKVGMFQPDKKLYPDYDKALENSMVGETKAFFREVLTGGLTLREFLYSDWSMLNLRLAQFYGLPVTSFEDTAMTKPREVALDRQVDRSWRPTQLAPAGLRWTGTLLPTYGPAYVGPWSVRGDKECIDGSCRGSRDNNASVSFRFRGTSIRVVGKTGPNYGFADIALDGQPQPQFDGYSPEVKRDATLFAKDNLSDGDHEVTVTVVGWHGKPRNKASSDSWVDVDKFVVNGLHCDDAGLAHTFTAQADGKVTLWLNRSEILTEPEPRSTREELTSKPIKLLRQQTPLQLNYTDATTTGGVLLQWSDLFQPKQPVPTSSLYPHTPGGYTIESLRQVGDMPKTAHSTP